MNLGGQYMGINYSVLPVFLGFEILFYLRHTTQPTFIREYVGFRGSHGCRPPGCFLFPGATLLLRVLAKIITDTCHEQPHNLQLPRKGTGVKCYNPHFMKEKTEAHWSLLTCEKSLQQLHWSTTQTPCFCFLHSQQLICNLLQRTNLGYRSHLTWTSNSGEFTFLQNDS